MKRLAAWAAPLGAVLAAAWLHAGGLRAPFFADDWLFLDATRHRSLLAALTAPDPIGNFARPLGRQAWFWLLDRAGGGSPLVFHAASLALFAAAVLLLAALVRRLAGARAAAVAAVVLALTHAADVPLRWASGSQDLLAVTLAIAALLAVGSNALLAGALYLLALLGKETVVLLPLVAGVLLACERPWRAVLASLAPMLVVAVLWAMTAGAPGLRFALAGAGSTPPAGEAALGAQVAAAFASFARTLAGAESSAGAAARLPREAWWLGALAAALVMLAAALTRPPQPAPRSATATAGPRARFAAEWVGLAWVVAGVLPVAPVAHLWSAYYFLFAIAGAACALGVLAARGPAWPGALLAAALAIGAAHGRALDAFARESGAWTTCSHVNLRYLREGAERSQALLAELRRLQPAPAPGTTFFWSGLPAWIAFQAADGPLVRVAYADTSLRAYYLADLTEARARRGPFRVLAYTPASGALVDRSDDRVFLRNTALSMLVRDAGEAVDGAFALARARGPLDADGAYVEAFRALERGDRDAAVARLAALGYAAGAGAEAEVRAAAEAIARGDTAAAAAIARRACARHVLDPAVQGLLADLWLPGESTRGAGVLAAYASRVLAPEFPYSWRRWATVQLLYGHYRLAQRSLERYFELAPEARAADAEAAGLLARLAQGPERAADAAGAP